MVLFLRNKRFNFMLFLGWLLSEVVEITNWGARLPQNRFGWRWLLFEELWTPSLVGVEPPTQLWFYFIQAVIPLLDHRDKDVREEGKKLIIESYRWIGNTSHLLIILSDRVFHLLLDRAQFKKLGFSELLENFKTLNHSKKKLFKLHAEIKRFFEYFVLNLTFKHRDHPIWYGTL